MLEACRKGLLSIKKQATDLQFCEPARLVTPTEIIILTACYHY